MDAWGLTQELNGEGLTIKQHSLIPESKLRDDLTHSKIRSVKRKRKRKSKDKLGKGKMKLRGSQIIFAGIHQLWSHPGC